MWIIFLATVNKCTATIMIIIIVNVKSFLERHFSGISISIFKNNLTFIKKLYCTLMHYKARQVLRDLFSTNQGIAQKWHLWQELQKNPKIWNPVYDWMTQWKKQFEGIDYIEMEDLNLWQILPEVLLELIS